MGRIPPVRYTLGYRLLFAFTIPLLLASVVMIADIILNPLQAEVFYGSVPFRLVGVVEETMQPVQVSLWLRPTLERIEDERKAM